MKTGIFVTPSAPPIDESLPIPVATAINDPSSQRADASTQAELAVEPPAPTTKAYFTVRGLPFTPVRMTCPFCNQPIITRTRREITGCTVVGVVGLMCCCLFWVPLVFNCVSFAFVVLQE